MTKKVLHVGEPLISAYTSYGCLFSIMNDELWPWVFNNFIQIRYAHWWGIYAFDCHHLLLRNCPTISYYELPQDIVISKWGKSLKKVIIEAIDLGYYLYIYADRYFISQTDAYNNDHFIHELFIYGYDLTKETVFVADNLEDGKFIKTECPFNELEEGYWTISGKYDFWTSIRYLKPNKQFECKINLEQITSSMENYLHSKKTFDLVDEQECDFGFQAINRLFQDITNAGSSALGLDMRGFHLLYEHKILMEMRLKYLMDNGFIMDNKLFLESSFKLKHDYLILRNLVLKFNLKRDDKMLDGISTKLRDNLIEEQKFISIFIEMIKDLTN